jgi:predicted nucleotidyltransferase component of viral defense system
MKPTQYQTAKAFRRALEDRLKTMADKQGLDVQRLRRQVAFDRLLSRFFSSDQAPWVLKGGYAMELRLDAARSTRDIDLTLRSTPVASHDPKQRNAAILDLLQRYAGIDQGDFFVCLVGEPMRELDAPLYGGARFPVETLMDDRLFASFHIDVAVGDVLIEPLEEMKGKDWLGFAGIAPTVLQAISAEQQFAEKLHAYTLPRQNPNSRVRDLVDIALLIEMKKLSTERVAKAIHATFERRKTHSPPKILTTPPAAWSKPFSALAKECGLNEDIAHAFTTLKLFIDNLA